MVRRAFSALMLIWVAAGCFAAGKNDEPKPAQSTGELRQQLCWRHHHGRLDGGNRARGTGAPAGTLVLSDRVSGAGDWVGLSGLLGLHRAENLGVRGRESRNRGSDTGGVGHFCGSPVRWSWI